MQKYLFFLSFFFISESIRGLEGEASHFDSPIKFVYDVKRWDNEDKDQKIPLIEYSTQELDEIAYVDITESEDSEQQSEQ